MAKNEYLFNSHIYTHADNHMYLPFILLLLFKNCIKLR